MPVVGRPFARPKTRSNQIQPEPTRVACSNASPSCAAAVVYGETQASESCSLQRPLLKVGKWLVLRFSARCQQRAFKVLTQPEQNQNARIKHSIRSQRIQELGMKRSHSKTQCKRTSMTLITVAQFVVRSSWNLSFSCLPIHFCRTRNTCKSQERAP